MIGGCNEQAQIREPVLPAERGTELGGRIGAAGEDKSGRPPGALTWSDTALRGEEANRLVVQALAEFLGKAK